FTSSSASVSGNGVSAQGSVVTITEAGTYVVSGTSANGQIVVNTADDAKVLLVLAGVNLTCDSSACIDVENADKVFVTLADGTTNNLQDGSSFVVADDAEIDATIYSKCDLTFNGTGTLSVTATAGHAIHSKDDLRFTGGNYSINSAKTGIYGKDSVMIKDGTFNVTSATDCIKSSNDEKDGKGFVYVAGGTFTLKSTDKGIQASKLVYLESGTLAVESTDDTIHSDDSCLLNGANLTLTAGDDAVHADSRLEVRAGTIDVKSCYEGFEASAVTISGATSTIYASDDGVNAATKSTTTTDGTTDTTDQNQANNQGSAPEQPSGTTGQTNGTTPPDKPSGDTSTNGTNGTQQGGTQPSGGGNAQPGLQNGATGDASEPNVDSQAGTQPGTQQGGGEGGSPFGSDDSILAITGGTLTVYASDGDCIDSNGNIVMTGGTVTLCGPSNDGNSSLDYDGTATISGGEFLAIGSAGMAQTFGSTSTQCSVSATVSGNSGDVVSVVDESGNVILSFTTNCNYSFIEASSSKFVSGSTYKILANGTELTTLTAGTSNGNSSMTPGNNAGGPGGDQQGGGAQPGGGQGAPSGTPGEQNGTTSANSTQVS
ncbi:MAG: carbohydrate-binding domain-containing protein, partial [Phoenicibacter congonensis]|nr:carbohydrate-binding domain-containing protein [Phoenicibacter congonensis]